MSFYTEVLQKHALFHSTSRCTNLDLLFPTMKAKVETIIKDAASKGTNFMVFETFRSNERQTQLFNQGATKLKTVGVHHYGLACDIVKAVNGAPSWGGSFDLLGQLARQNGLIWGGDWKGFVDADHVQFLAVRDQAKLFNGSFYPNFNYNPYAA